MFPYYSAKLFNASISRITLIKHKIYQSEHLSNFLMKWKTEYFTHIQNFHTFNIKSILKKGNIDLIDGTFKLKFVWDTVRLIQILKIMMELYNPSL